MSRSPSLALRRNLELKARLHGSAAAIEACVRLGAADHGILQQRDTYFRAREGRLKLREEPGRAELIAYRRSDRPEDRESRFRLVPIGEADSLLAALGDALGILAVVEKQRRLFIWRGVRIHLDLVEGLGDFVEFEAPMDREESASAAEGLLRDLAAALEIADVDRIAGSYCDLILGRTSPGAATGTDSPAGPGGSVRS